VRTLHPRLHEMDSDFAAAIERDMRFNPFLKDALSEIGLFIATRQINRSSTNTDIHIPADIIEIILDFLLDDVKSLGKCALVHRSWTTLCRHRLFSVITMHSDTDVPLMVEQLKAISDTHTREVRVEGMCRSNRYLWTRGDKMTYQHLAELSKLFPEGIPILTLSRSNLFFPDLSTVVSESLSTETLEAARLFLFKVQTLRFDFTEWLLSEDFQALVTDCVNATRLVLFNSCPPKALSMRSPLACTMKAAPLSRLKHLELVGLGSSFRRRKGADRLGKIFQWLVPDSTGTHLQTFTCVLVDVFIIHAWETFIGTSGRYIRTLRVSFVYDHENGSVLPWLVCGITDPSVGLQPSQLIGYLTGLETPGNCGTSPRLTSSRTSSA
jgi:hypothetical protein